jgi:hypothetical protein
VLLKKHDFKAKYNLFSCLYNRLCILREFDEFAPKTLEINESETKKVKKKSSKFVEFGRLFVRKIRKIRLYISALPTQFHEPFIDAFSSEMLTHFRTVRRRPAPSVSRSGLWLDDGHG